MPRITFEVEGRCTFPLDMLRYDRCYPIEGIPDLFYACHTPGDKTCRVKLRSEDAILAYVPCHERWRSFGWYVVDGSIQVEG